MNDEKISEEFRFLAEELLRGAEAVQRDITELRRVQERIKALLDFQGQNIQAAETKWLKTILPDAAKVGERRKALSHLRDFTRDAVHLTIVDPYIYSGKSNDWNDHVEDFAKCTCLGKNAGLKSVHIIYDSAPDRVTKRIRSEIKKRVKAAAESFTEKATDKVHDRIWIKDHREAVVTGTSLGGIGNKLSFILELPDEDLRELKRFLRDQSLLPIAP